MTGPLRLAHRGDWRAAPENTLGAFAAALRIPGCDGLEFDVRLAADGTPIVLHDETLDRVQGRPERAVDLTVAELSVLHVPTLEAVLAAAPADVFLDIELKGRHGSATVEVIAAHRATPPGGTGSSLRHAVVSSFEPDALDAVGAERPDWARWLNAEDLEPATIALARELGCSGISADHLAIDRRSAARVAQAGLALAAYTVRRTSTYRRLAGLGVVAICSEGAALDRGEGRVS